jgi:hypothetical protein
VPDHDPSDAGAHHGDDAAARTPTAAESVAQSITIERRSRRLRDVGIAISNRAVEQAASTMTTAANAP